MNSNYQVGDLIYDANIYDGMNTDLADLHFYKRWLPKSKDARILELCCGTGRLTLPIAKDGYNISGVDYTSSMLDQAKIKASEAGLEIRFIEADIRTLNLQDKYDLVFIPFNSIHHLYKNEDLFRAFNVVKNHLKEARVEKNLSQAALAEMVGVSRNTISSIETGQFNPTAKLALILCIALDKKFEELFYFD